MESFVSLQKLSCNCCKFIDLLCFIFLLISGVLYPAMILSLLCSNAIYVQYASYLVVLSVSFAVLKKYHWAASAACN